MLGKSVEPTIPAKEARKSVELLSALGFIQRDSEGNWRPTVDNISTSGNFDGMNVANFHRSTLELAIRALDVFPPEQKGFSTLTLPLTLDKIRKAKLAIKNLRMYLFALSENGACADRVYQFNFHLFPVTPIHSPNDKENHSKPMQSEG